MVVIKFYLFSFVRLVVLAQFYPRRLYLFFLTERRRTALTVKRNSVCLRGLILSVLFSYLYFYRIVIYFVSTEIDSSLSILFKLVVFVY